MLALTQEAIEAVRDVLADDELPDAAGLRISTLDTDGATELGLQLAPEPIDGDQVIDESGARLFLDESAATLLDDQVLDAVAHGDHLHFTFKDQED
jgi:iron-sulfur cluster assembly protein